MVYTQTTRLLFLLLQIPFVLPCGLDRGVLDLALHLAGEVLGLTSVTVSVDMQCLDSMHDFVHVFSGSQQLPTVLFVDRSEDVKLDLDSLFLAANLENNSISDLGEQLQREPRLPVLLGDEYSAKRLPLRLDSQVCLMLMPKACFSEHLNSKYSKKPHP